MKLISLNVEGSKHWDRIRPFLEKNDADVLCFQEVFQDDLAPIAEKFGMRIVFAPMGLRKSAPLDNDGPYKMCGIALLSRLPIKDIQINYYNTPTVHLTELDNTNEYTIDATVWRGVISAIVSDGNREIVMATTHFTWTPDGLSKPYQWSAATSLLKILSHLDEVVFCGDLNIPRGVNENYERFAEQYHDAIPISYTSSMDLELHRSGKIPEAAEHLSRYMVDHLFISKGYHTEDVRLQNGVSDHCAIVATIK